MNLAPAELDSSNYTTTLPLAGTVSVCLLSTSSTTCPAMTQDPLPTLSTAFIAGDELVLDYGEALDENSVPATSAFTVTANGTAVSVSTVSVSGRRVTLDLAAAVAEGQTVVVNYAVPTLNPLQDLVGSAAAALAGQAVENWLRTAEFMGGPSDTYLVEGGSVAVTVSLGSPPRRRVVIPLSFQHQFGASGPDYMRLPSSLTFRAEQTTQTFTMTAVDDSAIVVGKQTVLTFGTPAPFGVTLSGDDTAKGERFILLVDNDFLYQASYQPSQTYEVGEAAGALTVTVQLRTPDDVITDDLLALGETVVVSVASVDGTATAGTDYTALSGPILTFAATDFEEDDDAMSDYALAEKTVVVPITDDMAYEGDETFTLTLSHVSGQRVEYPAASGGATATVTIKEDDAVPPMLSTAVVDGAELVLTYDKALDGTSVPATGAFTVTANGATVSVSTVSVSGTKVTLELAAAVLAVQTVEVDYAVPSSSPLQDTAGTDAGALVDQAVENQTLAAEPVWTALLRIGATSGKLGYSRLEDLVPGDFEFGGVMYTVRELLASTRGLDFEVDRDGLPTGGKLTLEVAGDAGNRLLVLSGAATKRWSFGTTQLVSTNWTEGHFTTVCLRPTAATTVCPAWRYASTPPPSATLTGLAVAAGGTAVPLTPVFASATTAYAAVVPAGTATVTVVATATDTGATVTITPPDAASGTSGHQVALAPGANTVVVQVTVDGKAAGAYTVTVAAAAPPAAPSAPTVSAVSGQTDQLSVSWTAPSDGNSAITDYDVRYCPGAAADCTADADFTEHAFTGTSTSTTIATLMAATEHQVQVRAINAEGTGAWSASGSGTTGTPMLTAAFVGAQFVYLAEGGAGATVTVRLSGAPGRQVAIPLDHRPQFGASSSDYTEVPSSLTFGAAETERSFTVEAVDDPQVDLNERLIIYFGTPAPPGITLSDDSVSTGRKDLILVDNGFLYQASYQPSQTYAAGEAAGALTVTVRLRTPESIVPAALRSLNETVEVSVSSADGTAMAGTDYTALSGLVLSFAAADFVDDTSAVFDYALAEKTVVVPITDDMAYEGDETFTLTLSHESPQRVEYPAASGGATATVTITEDDAAPPADRVLVSNLGQPNKTSISGYGTQAQGFRTGRAVAGYALSSVQLSLRKTAVLPATVNDLNVTLRSADNNSNPGSVLATFTKPTSPTLDTTRRTFTFTLSSAATLDANTQYFIHMSFPNSVQVNSPQSGNEDSSSLAYWGIDDGGKSRNSILNTWPGVSPFKLRVNGYAKVPSFATLSGLTVSAGGTTFDLDQDFMAETTDYSAEVPADTATVTVAATAADTGATVTITPTDAASGTVGHQVALAPGSNTVLAQVAVAGKMAGTYTVTVNRNRAPMVANQIPDQPAAVGAAFRYQLAGNTFSDADGDGLSYMAMQSDDAALPGWLTFAADTRIFSGMPQVADAGTVSVKVTAGDGKGGSVSDTFDITVAVPPVLSTAVVGEAELVLTYDGPLDETSVPATGAFTVTANGATVSVNTVSVSGAMVTLDLAVAVAEGQTVVVDYVVPSLNPLQDGTGIDAGPLMDQAVENWARTAAFVGEVGADVYLVEGGAGVEVTVRLSSAPGRQVALSLAIGLLNATRTDYMLSPSSLTFEATETERTFTITAEEDSEVDLNESIAVSFGAPVPFGIIATDENSPGGSTRTIHLVDNDFLYQASYQPSQTYEAGEAAGALTVMVRLQTPDQVGPEHLLALGETVEVSVSSADGTTTAGSDYTALSGLTLTFAATDFDEDDDAMSDYALAEKTVVVPITDDMAHEGDETFTLTLSHVTGQRVEYPAASGGATATVTITDDDAAPPTGRVLVSNAGQSSIALTGIGTRKYAQGFRTGKAIAGYALSSVELLLQGWRCRIGKQPYDDPAVRL